MFVAQDVSFKLQFDPPYCLPTVVDDMGVHVDTSTTNPHLAVQTSSQTDDFNGSVPTLHPFVRCCEGAG